MGISIATGMTVSAQAEMVTFAFEGNLSQVDAPLASTWNLGQAFSGTYTFDSNAANAGAPGDGDYQRAPQDFHAMIGTAELIRGIPAPIGGLGSIMIDNGGVRPGGDSYRVRIATDGPPVSGLTPFSFRLDLIDSTSSALINNNLTSVPPILSAFQERTVTFAFSRFDPVTGDISFASAVGQVTGLTPVPLPAAAVFFGTGLLGLAGHRGVRQWRRSRHHLFLHKPA
jgi:hypothetical protein